MGSHPPPRAPSSLIRVSRWSFLAMGFFYGSSRYSLLKVEEDKLRAQQEAERPAKEAAMKAERDRKNQEEMEYLAQQAGVTNKGSAKGGKGGSGGTGGGGGGCTCDCDGCGCNRSSGREYRSDCGCSY